MAKWIVKAQHTANQIRISIPVHLIQQLGWEGAILLLMEKKGKSIRVTKFVDSEDMEGGKH